ncbi:MAG TPA: energy transducer TonB [Steroidobacteraceae bacterium]|jgi:TonB family protein|nr:energy transducer TonB [Steroidobacteraceae bacterium]
MEQPARHPSASPEERFDSHAVTVTTDSSPGASARPAPPVVTLSEDPMLLEAISAATLDLVQVIVAPSADRFIDQVVATGGELALIDASAVPDDLAQFLVSIHQQFPQLQLLLAGPGNVQHLIGSQITDGTVYRFVHKPASAQRLKLFVDAALRERQTRITAQILRSPFPAPAAAEPAVRDSGRPGWLMAAAGMVLLIAAAGAVIWYSSLSEPPVAKAQPPALAPAVVVPRPAPAPIATRAAAPPAARATHTASPGALTEAEQAAVDRAAAERSERSEKERLAAEAEARQAAQAEQARRADSDARLAQIHQWVQLARSRIASGALIEPANDSARTYVSDAQEQAPDDQEVRAVSVALGDALINSFRKALAAGNTAAAEEWLKACRAYQISRATLDQMAVQLESFRAAQVAQSGATKAVENALAADALVTAPATPVAGPKPVQASTQILQEGDLHRIDFNPPKYPPDALMRGETGTVELDFTVTPAGTVTDIKVTRANPIGVFEQASIAALVHNRYEPVLRDGAPVAQRAHIRMRFAL